MMSGTLFAAAAVLLLSPLASDAQNDDDDRRVRHTASLFLAELGDLVLDADRAFERLTAPKVAFEERLVQAPRDLFLQSLFSRLQRRIGETAPQGSVSMPPGGRGSRLRIVDQLEGIDYPNVIRGEAQRTSSPAAPRRSIGMPPEDRYYSTLHGKVSEEPSYEELNVNPLQKRIGETAPQGSVSMPPGVRGTQNSRLRISDWLEGIDYPNVVRGKAQRTSSPAAPRRSIGMSPEDRYDSTLYGKVSEEPSYEELNVNPLLKEEEDEHSRFFWTT